MTPKSCCGFTLVEMIITVVIVGIMSSITYISLMKSYYHHQSMAMMSQLNSAIHYMSSMRGEYEMTSVYLEKTGSILYIYQTGWYSGGTAAKLLASDIVSNSGYLGRGTFGQYTYDGTNWIKIVSPTPGVLHYEFAFKQYPEQIICTYPTVLPVSVSSTWVAVPVSYTQLKLEYTDTAANVYSIIIDCQTGATTTSGF